MLLDISGFVYNNLLSGCKLVFSCFGLLIFKSSKFNYLGLRCEMEHI